MKVMHGRRNAPGMVTTSKILQWAIRSQVLHDNRRMDAVHRLDGDGSATIAGLRYSRASPETGRIAEYHRSVGEPAEGSLTHIVLVLTMRTEHNPR
jgi:hypothetical protein